MYIKNSITYKIIDELDLNLNFAENIWIEIETNKKSIVVGVVYRHPGYIVNQIELFTKAIEKIFLNMSNKKMEFYLVGDCNIDLLQFHCNQIIKTYADNLLGYSVKCCINKPTRILATTKSLLDHIYTNDFNRSPFSGIALCDISDHLPTFIFIKDIKYIKKKSEEVYICDMKNFSEELFCQDLYKPVVFNRGSAEPQGSVRTVQGSRKLRKLSVEDELRLCLSKTRPNFKKFCKKH